ncbi:hypothetical protein [[Mycoplasma] testudinis]|uniref:hypothetical protein n=1 Tax=[Mycoplasma] testudinis TaxID=33924 RepID=UPI00048664EE|nr:hypothetical protein [[Mycoplasma] testudinis]
MEFNLQHHSHAILITESQGSYLTPFLTAYLKSIVCTSKIENKSCDACENCTKIKNNLYYDIIDVDGSVETISKDRIIEIQNRFLRMGLERGNKKVYIIHQIELASSQAVNALLKFLEEPPNNTYAILTTRNQLVIPQTITSRCQRVLLKKNNFDWSQTAIKYNLKKADIKSLTDIYWTIDDALAALKDNTFSEVSELSFRFLNTKKSLEELNAIFEKFKSLSFRQIQLVLNYLIVNLDITCWDVLVRLSNDLKLNPIRSAMFWQIIRVIERCQKNG